ncbi:MAG: molecular chaperone DnaK, partial [Bdellovibrio sp. CG10_big_fil_rev_8_21_14_0_10_47_8]
ARSGRAEFAANDKNSGDEIDQTVAQLAEHHFLVSQERVRRQLLEIEFALARIEAGQFGICEETQEPIEIDRLLAIPYTRLSIEGAEIREMSQRKFAQP